jgi:hypothetical protein
MNRNHLSATLSFALLAAATLGITSSARAQSTVWDKVTHITIDQPMEVPGGVILQPGKYVMRLADTPSDRHVVEFLNDDQTHIYATVGAINNSRMTPTGKTVITFNEMPAGQPEAIRAWFYPGDNFGQEFIYKKHRGEELSRITKQTVQTEPEEVAVAEAPAPAPEPQAVVSAPAPAPEPAPLVAQNEPAPAPAPAPEPAPAPQTLPQTASDIPLFALIGFLSIGAAFGVRSYAKRTN